MKFYIAILTFYDQNDQLRSTPMTMKAKSKNSAVIICKQQAANKYKLLPDDIVDIHMIPNKKEQGDLER